MGTIRELQTAREAAHAVFKECHDFLSRLVVDKDFIIGDVHTYATSIEATRKYLLYACEHWIRDIAHVEVLIVRCCAADLEAVELKGLTFATAHQAAIQVASDIDKPFELVPSTFQGLPWHSSSLAKSFLDEIAYCAKAFIWEDHKTSELVARIDKEFAIAIKTAEPLKPQATPQEMPSTDSNGSAPEAHLAHLEKLFPLGIPESADLRDAVLELQTKRADDNTDRGILQEFFGGDTEKAKKIADDIRGLRSKGRTTLPPRSKRT